jgi:hypothetical protein
VELPKFRDATGQRRPTAPQLAPADPRSFGTRVRYRRTLARSAMLTRIGNGCFSILAASSSLSPLIQ